MPTLTTVRLDTQTQLSKIFHPIGNITGRLLYETYEQATKNKQQKTKNKQQRTSNKQQATKNKKQKTKSPSGGQRGQGDKGGKGIIFIFPKFQKGCNCFSSLGGGGGLKH